MQQPDKEVWDYKGVSPTLMTSNIELASDLVMDPIEAKARENLVWLIPDGSDRAEIMEALGL